MSDNEQNSYPGGELPVEAGATEVNSASVAAQSEPASAQEHVSEMPPLDLDTSSNIEDVPSSRQKDAAVPSSASNLPTSSDFPSSTHTQPGYRAAPSIVEGSVTPTPGSVSANTSAGNTATSKSAGAIKKKDLMRPLFSRSSTTDKVASKPGVKSMIVETETVDASNTPTVTLPIASSSSVISGELMSNTSTLVNNLASLRSKKSTIFVDQNNVPSTQPVSGSTFDNDNTSVTGSVRNPSKRLNPADSHLNISKPGATKADLFAAKIANAVGDASDSDSEETFVYESAPDALTTNTLPPIKTAPALSSTNTSSLRKLSQRNISMPVTNTSNLHHHHPLVSASHAALETHGPIEQDLRSYDTEEESDHTTIQDQRTLTKLTTENQQPPVRTAFFTKYNESRKPSAASLIAPQKNGNVSQLRTTTSKLFDVKGGTLRRYSGVPDDMNIEDYLDQYDEEHGIGGSDYAGSYHYEDEDDEDELTPLNVNNANHNLRSKMNKHYQTKRSVSNFGAIETGDNGDMSSYKDETVLRRPGSLKGKRHYLRSHQQQHEQQQYSPHNFNNRKKSSRLQLLKNVMCLSVTVFVLLFVGFIGGFLLANTKELQDVQIVSVDDIIVSLDELVFDLSVGAYNHGLLTVGITDVELDIFAKSSHLKEYPLVPGLDGQQGDVQTILLGSVTRFETPLRFTSGFFHRNYTLSKGEIKLVHPGQNTTDSNGGQENHKAENDIEKWRRIIDHPFDLIVKGRLIYEVPLLRTEQSTAVTKTVSVDPTEDSDDGDDHDGLILN